MQIFAGSGAGSNLKVEGHNFRRAAPEKNFFTVPLNFFVVPQGTIDKKPSCLLGYGRPYCP